jgi:hypothetical protein
MRELLPSEEPVEDVGEVMACRVFDVLCAKEMEI